MGKDNYEGITSARSIPGYGSCQLKVDFASEITSPGLLIVF